MNDDHDSATRPLDRLVDMMMRELNYEQDTVMALKKCSLFLTLLLQVNELWDRQRLIDYLLLEFGPLSESFIRDTHAFIGSHTVKRRVNAMDHAQRIQALRWQMSWSSCKKRMRLDEPSNEWVIEMPFYIVIRTDSHHVSGVTVDGEAFLSLHDAMQVARTRWAGSSAEVIEVSDFISALETASGIPLSPLAMPLHRE